MRGANYCRVLFVTGFADNLSHAELVGRFEEYGNIVSTKRCLPEDPEGYAHAFIGFASSKDATTARLRLHQSVVKGHKLEVHFETKIPPIFNQMLNDSIYSAPATSRRSYGEERAPSADYSSRASPTPMDHRLGMSNERSQQSIYHSTSNARSPSYNDRRYEDRLDDSRSHARSRYGAPQGYQGSRRYPEDRIGGSPSVRERYVSRASGASRPYNRPQGGRGGYGARTGYRGGRSMNRAPFFDRGGRGFEEHHSQDQQDPQDKYDQYRPQSAINNEEQQQGWRTEDPVRADSGQLSPRNSRSRSTSVEPRSKNGWLRSPSPMNGKSQVDMVTDIPKKEGINSFNEDSLFDAP
ncbi:hypothetical protein COEREDRAFT_7599 [Coemansia reversa NRRL 1564]|uniref:RRM domain-containing protein n=1 Tax=Coemansia reversa (strain ATCC 12441 / NRRL 1564) TaxID=763665 RepID=A0A2G5BE16_COERN|nr:hypothetical protein COEREDRAFT_7599 [Coemansia reversa NRRL 1564]|eukprot:PIA17241.1 hypothetical protein COEREDRAFT_7599 [Coemansia reversa NRRL 1564]